MARKPRAAANSPLEWVMAVIGALTALALLGVIGGQALTGNQDMPAALVARAERIMPVEGGYAAEISVRNLSDRTAAAVQVEGVLRQGDAAVEASRATIDYVPGGARTEAGLLFTRDPAAHRLELRVTGYQEP